MIEDIRFGVSIAAPGADSNDYVIFDSTVAFGFGQMATKGIDRLGIGWNNSQAATLKLKFLRAGTGGTTGVAAIYDTNQTIGPLVANAGLTGSTYDFVAFGLGEVQLVVTNGGVAQANWPPVVTGARGQKAPSV